MGYSCGVGGISVNKECVAINPPNAGAADLPHRAPCGDSGRERPSWPGHWPHSEDASLRTDFHEPRLPHLPIHRGELNFLRCLIWGFLVDPVMKNLPANAGECRRCGVNPWLRKSPWRRKWQPTPGFLPGKPHGQRSLVGHSLWGRTELT